MTATQLTLTDPTPIDPDAEHRKTMVWAIESVAELNNGHVSLNAARAYLADFGITLPRHIPGQEVARLRREGHLVETGVERSTDTRSGNGGRIIPVYRFVERP